jgi:hypothetical protein
MKETNSSKETHLIQMANSCYPSKVEIHENRSPKKKTTTNMAFANPKHILTIRHNLTITTYE